MPLIKSKSFYCFSFIFCFFLSFSSFGKAPIKFGKPSVEDVKMEIYEPDSTAEAVILCNYGYFNSSSLKFTQLIRIKVLKKSGTYLGNRRYYAMDGNIIIRGKTFNFENGEVAESKLKNESIFKKKLVNNSYTVSVAMPNVKVGSVIDIEVTSLGLPRLWRFQELIPVKRSELVIEQSQYIEYQKSYFGYLPISTAGPDHWLATDVPALKKEPFMDSYKNYISKFEFDVKRIILPGHYKEYAVSWNDVAEVFLDSDYFGVILKAGSGYLKDLSLSIENECSTDMEKVKMAYDKIKEVKWNEEKSDFCSTTSLGSVFKDKIGNSTDINILLIKLLDRLDIKAYPVLLSTRDNGLLSLSLPSLNKLNYSICCVELNGEKILIDATEEKLPLGLLPERVINNFGRIIYSKEITEDVSLKAKGKRRIQIYQDLQLDTDNSISGKRSVVCFDYAAYNKRKEFDNYNSDEEYLASCEAKNKGLSITNFELKNRDDIYDKLVESWDFKLKKHVEVIDDLLMINMNLFDKIDENQYKLEKRTYPINYPYCSEKRKTVKISLPQGYELSEIPKPVKIGLPNQGGAFIMNYVRQGNTIIMNSIIRINKEIFLPEEYPYLKEFFAQVIKKQAEPIILKKS